MKTLKPHQSNSIMPANAGASIRYLSENQVNDLVQSFQEWFDNASLPVHRKNRGRYWLTFLVLRFTGARLGEVLSIDDSTDIDFRNAEIRLVTLKRRVGTKPPLRIVPVPATVISEIATYRAEFPLQKGKLFKLDQGNFRRAFTERSNIAQIPPDLAHPHVLRHTRAIELLRAGVPITGVQDLLGHSAVTTTAIYLRMSGQEVKAILKDRGLI